MNPFWSSVKQSIDARNLIRRGEGSLSLLQILGFWLIIAGVIALFFQLGLNAKGDEISGQKFGITFFIIMLGVAFANPDLLQDATGGLSTMRMVVFMFTNVICLIFIKVGWSVHNLEEFHLSASWVSLIAFVFGSKAAQSYFERKFPDEPNSGKGTPPTPQKVMPSTSNPPEQGPL